MIFQAGEGREKKGVGVGAQPGVGAGVGAVGADRAGEELNGGKEGPFGPGVPGPVGDGKRNGGTSSGGMEQEQTELVAEGTESQKSLKPPERPMAGHHLRFNQQQLEQLETIFQRSHSSDEPAR